MLLLSPKGERIALGSFSLKYAHQLVSLLAELHSFKYVHRDIRPDNIMSTREHGLLLIDFGFAVKRQTIQPFYGTLHFASDAVLAKLINGQTSFSCDGTEDLESAVRAIFAMVFHQVQRDLMAVDMTDYGGIREFWKKAFSGKKPWLSCLKAARSSDYAKMKSTLGQLLY